MSARSGTRVDRFRPRRRAQRTQWLWAAGVLAGLALVAGLFVSMQRDTEKYYVSVLVDASPSNKNGRCADLERLLSDALRRSEGGDLVFKVYATTDDARGRGVDVVGEVTRAKKGIEIGAKATGSEAARRLAEVHREQVQALCARIEERKQSPIFQAASFVLSDLVASDCGADTVHCRLVLRTDGIEERDALILAALKKPTTDEREARLVAPGVEVEMCGLSQIEGLRPSSVPSFDRIRDAWAPELGADGEDRISATCAPAAPALAEASEPAAGERPSPTLSDQPGGAR